MESLITYRNEAFKENIQPIREKTDHHYNLLNEATLKFISTLEDIEKRYLNSQETPEELLNAITMAMTNMHRVCEQFERRVGYESDIIKEARIEFRKKTDHVLSKSYFINRTRTWPQGYKGDYKTLEYVYRNTPLSQGLGYYWDLYFLNVKVAHGVKNRIKRLENILREEISVRKRPAVLNVACGSCRELMGASAAIINSEAKVICVDFDNDALDFAQNRLYYTGALPQIELRKYNAARMFDHELNMAAFGMQDIIYSVGYFDYLEDDFLVKMLRALYALLNPGGKLIMTFKDADYYKTQDYHWLIDWDGFLQRNENDFKRILEKAGIPDTALSQSRDKSKVIIFCTATK